MSKPIRTGLIVAALVAAGWLVWRLILSVINEVTPVSPNTAEPAPAGSQSPAQTAQYQAYAEAELGNQYQRHIIFFHASWCPECRAFEQALLNETLPSDVQILKADFDSETELKQKYSVVIQSTFVEVDRQGELVAKWVGYGRDKSFAAVERGLGESR